MRIVLLTVALLASGLSRPVAACSMVEGYKVPTTLELIEKSDTIVLARVGDEIPGDDERDMGEIVLTPELLIAGHSLPPKFRFRGYHSSDRLRATASDPNELARANPDAFSGFCNRYVFDRDMLLLLFLGRDEAGKTTVIDAAFARTLEDVPTPDSLWVRAVRYYANVVQLPRDQRKTAMKAEAERLQSTGDATDALLAKDIRRQIKQKRTQNYD